MSDLSMKPSREDLVHREQAAKNSKSRPSKASGGGNSSKVTVLIVLLFISLVGAGGAGWLLWQQLELVTQRLDNSNIAQADSVSVLGSLKSELEVSKRSLSNEKNAMSEDITVLKSEIRKLWDVSNKRNKKSIQSNKDSLAALSQSDRKQKSELAGQEKVASVLSITVSQLQDELASYNQGNAKLVGGLKSLKEQVDSLKVENNMLKNLAVEQEQLLQVFKNGKLQQEIKDLGQAVDAIDAHRRQVNGRLDQMDKELGALYAKQKS